MYCQKCRNEYDEGVTVCPICRIELLDEEDENEISYEAMKPVKLATIKSVVEADLIMNLLEINGIQCFKKHNGAGSYMKLYYGFTVFGIDIFVDEEDYEKACEIVRELSPENNPISEIEDDSYQNYPFYKNPKILGRILLIGTVLIGALLIIITKTLNV